MKRKNIFVRVFNFYREGFASMTTGRTLWLIIIIKLAIMFLVIRLFFMPNTIKTKAPAGHEADYVEQQVTRGATKDATR